MGHDAGKKFSRSCATKMLMNHWHIHHTLLAACYMYVLHCYLCMLINELILKTFSLNFLRFLLCWMCIV